MSRKVTYICDRCKDSSNNQYFLRWVTVEKLEGNVTREFCPECIKKTLLFMEPYNKEVE